MTCSRSTCWRATSGGSSVPAARPKRMSCHRHECPRHQSINEPGIRPRITASLLLEPDVERGPDHDLRAGFRGFKPDLSRTIPSVRLCSDDCGSPCPPLDNLEMI